MITRILLALMYIQNSITMPHLAVIQLMRLIKWPRSDSDGSCVNKKGRGYKGFYSITEMRMSLLAQECFALLKAKQTIAIFFYCAHSRAGLDRHDIE